MWREKTGKAVKVIVVIAGLVLCCVVCDQVQKIPFPHEEQAAPAPTLTPTSAPDIEGEILHLIDAAVIEVKPQGAGIRELKLGIRRLVDKVIKVEIPAGTYFVSQIGSIQNMVVRNRETVLLKGDDWIKVSLDVACANMRLGIPDSKDIFSIQRLPPQDELQILIPVLEATQTYYMVEQAAVWIVTDDADYADLGILVGEPGFAGLRSRVIDEDDAARGMQLVDEAGIDITKKSIWQDRDLIAAGVEDSSLLEWIQAR